MHDAKGTVAQPRGMALTSIPFVQRVIRHARLLKLHRKLAMRFDDGVAAAIDNGLMMAVIAVVIIVGVTAVVAIKVGFIFEDLARSVTQLGMH
jgi:Flp pilus assembly pilin Flp